MSNDSHNITVFGNVENAQLSQVMTSCANSIQMHEDSNVQQVLQSLDKQIQSVLFKLSDGEKAELAKNWQHMVAEATSQNPNPKWYSISSAGILDASKLIGAFTENIAKTIEHLRTLLWPE